MHIDKYNTYSCKRTYGIKNKDSKKQRFATNTLTSKNYENGIKKKLFKFCKIFEFDYSDI